MEFDVVSFQPTSQEFDLLGLFPLSIVKTSQEFNSLGLFPFKHS